MPHREPIRVLIVDDSAVVRGVLGRVVDAESDMRVATTATNGQTALDALRQTPIDVVLLDIEMPVMDGLTALPLIVERFPDVRVLVTSSLTRDGAAVTMRALALGAVDYVHKPVAKGGVQGVTAAAVDVIAKIRAVARARSRQAAADPAAPAPAPAHWHPATNREAAGEPRVLLLAASTGGPNALAAVVAGLPGDLPIPVLVTQHMPPTFTALFAQRLARAGGLPCAEGLDGEPLAGGRVYVAPGDYHMTVARRGTEPVLHLTQDPPEHHCRPAADPMFRSAAEVFGGGVVAVVLTGMGEDGRRGCETIAAAGGRVIVQDEATSVVWGMPGSVVTAGVPCTILPLPAIAGHVTTLCAARA